MERHATDFVSLVFGLLFAAAGAAVLFDAVPFLSARDFRWLTPLLLLVLGAWLIASTALPLRRTVAGEPDELSPDEPTTPD